MDEPPIGRTTVMISTNPTEATRSKRYPAYKDSGVEWLGEVPEHWEVRRTKQIAWLESGHTPSLNFREKSA